MGLPSRYADHARLVLYGTLGIIFSVKGSESSTQAEEKIWSIIKDIPDPEIPVVTLDELGIIRGVAGSETTASITITPTFSGCPALDLMKDEIVVRLKSAGFESVDVLVVYSPPWTTDWIAPVAHEKLKKFGIYPPPRHEGQFEIILQEMVPCPFCDSSRTEVRNHFGPTPCRALGYCFSCQQPFEWFKPI